MKDEVLGDLEYDYGWRRAYSYPIFGRNAAVTLVIPCDEGDEIEPAQREAFARFDGDKGPLGQKAELAIYEHYLGIVDELREQFGPTFADEWAPRINTIEQLEKLITPTEVLVKESFGRDTRIVGLLFDCAWASSLGLAVRIENEVVAEVGPQDIVL